MICALLRAARRIAASWRRVAVAAVVIYAFVVAPFDAFASYASLFNCSTLRAPAAIGRTRVALLAAVLQLVVASVAGQIAAFVALASRGSLSFGGSAGRQCRQACRGQDPRRAAAGDLHACGMASEALESSTVHALAYLDTSLHFSPHSSPCFNRSGTRTKLPRSELVVS